MSALETTFWIAVFAACFVGVGRSLERKRQRRQRAADDRMAQGIADSVCSSLEQRYGKPQLPSLDLRDPPEEKKRRLKLIPGGRK